MKKILILRETSRDDQQLKQMRDSYPWQLTVRKCFSSLFFLLSIHVGLSSFMHTLKQEYYPHLVQ